MADTFWSLDFWASDFWADGFWTNAGAPEPEPEVAQRHAGRKRRRLLVEIDGNTFEVESVDHARALLDQAKTLAEKEAPKVAERLARQRVATNRPVPTPTPRISSSHEELRAVVATARKRIGDVYRKAAIDEEIRLRLQMQQKEDDDDDDIILLLL